MARLGQHDEIGKHHLGIRWLFAFVLVPGILVSALLIYVIYESERTQLEQGALQTARALSQAMDRDIAGIKGKLQVLAISESLQGGDLAAFYKKCKAVLASEDLAEAIGLIDESGQQIINTLRPFASTLPMTSNLASLRRLFETGQPAVSDLYIGAISQRHFLAIDVPVSIDGKTRYLLRMAIPAERLNRLLLDQHLPEGWVAALFDSKATVIARTLNPSQVVGKKATSDLIAEMDRSREGTMASHNLEGVPSFVAFSRSMTTGLTTTVGMTRDVLYAKLYRPVALAGLVIAIFLAGGAVLGQLFSNHVRGALQKLIAALEAATSGDLDVVAEISGPSEIDRLADQFNLMQSARRDNETQLRIAATAFNTQEGMVVTDADSVILRVNPAFTAITGYSAADIVGKTPQVLKSGRHDAEFYRAMWESIDRTGGWQGEIWDKRKNGEEYPKWLTISAVKDGSGKVTHYVGAHFDITARKAADERINELAYFDQLTGLPNRTLLTDRLRQALAASSRSGAFGAVLFIDLDNFKTLNDTLGHDVGDLLLQQAAKRIAGCVREGDTVARLGGDEFVVVLGGLSTAKEDAATGGEVAAEKILATLMEPYQLGDVPYSSGASIGVTLFLGDTTAIDDLMKQADLAMYRAKADGRRSVRFFDPTLESAMMERSALEKDLRRAVAEHRFELHYQAQVDRQGEWTGAEVLLRWQHPQRGLLFPDTFIGLAEETGLILPIGQWVLETACTQLATWAGQPDCAALTLAVNVSGHQLRQRDFVEQVLATLERTGADPQKLKLELTESHFLCDVEDTIVKMNALRDRGVSFALDDFGTGYSSLAYLKRLPLEKLKIDRSFVMDVLTDPNAGAIAKTIVALARTLGLEVIAEGVETEEQRSFLAQHGCHWYQGYLFGRPIPLAQYEALAQRAKS